MPKSTTNPADSMTNPVVIKADGTEIEPPASTADAVQNTSDDEQRFADAVNVRVQAELAARGIDAVEDSLELVEITHRVNYVTELKTAMLTLVRLMDIDIEQVDPTAEPVMYATRAAIRDVCYQGGRNVSYNEETLGKKAVQLRGMINRHDGSDQYDEKITNMETFMRGVEMQLEAWQCWQEAAGEAYFEIWGSEYGKKMSSSKVVSLTAASRSASQIADRYLKHDEQSKSERNDLDHRAKDSEIDELRREVNQLRNTG